MRNGLAVLVYDGDCGFCTTSAHWVATHWPDDTAAIVASQTVTDEELLAAGLLRSDVDLAVWWIDQRGPVSAHRAVARALTACEGALGLAGRLLSVPPLRWLAKPAYRIVAQNRHHLPGATLSCQSSRGQQK